MSNDNENKNDGGVKVTLSLNNEMLAQMISKGIEGLPKEAIHTLSYEAMKTALQDREFLKHLMFRTDSAGYNWWDQAHLQPWLSDLLSKSFTDDEVKEFRDGIMDVLKKDYNHVVIKALSDCFMRRLSDFDFTDNVKALIYQTLDERANR